MTTTLFQASLTALWIAGSPSGSLWAVVLGFTLSGLAFGTYAAISSVLKARNAGRSSVGLLIPENGTPRRTPSVVTSRTLPRMATMAGKGLALMLVGFLINQAWEYNHTFVLWDLRVVAEPGDRVADKVVPADTFYFQRASGPVGQMFPRTFCQKYVPGLHDGYKVEVVVATAEHYPVDCWNVAPGPLGIVYNQGE